VTSDDLFKMESGGKKETWKMRKPTNWKNTY